MKIDNIYQHNFASIGLLVCENIGVDTKFMFVSALSAEILPVQDCNGGHFEKWPPFAQHVFSEWLHS